MKTPEKIGIYSVFIIVLTLVASQFYWEDYKEIMMWLTGLAFTVLIPFIYDDIQQRRKRRNVIKFIERVLEDIKTIKLSSKNIKGIEEIKHIKEMILQYIKEFENIKPYIQNTYNEKAYATYNRRIDYLRNYKIIEKLDNYGINKEFNNYYNMVLSTIKDIKEMLLSP